MKKTLQYAFFVAGMASLPAMAHVGYGGRDFGTLITLTPLPSG
ncbi:hypothetical protein [Nitrosovibrio sp. Nv6]|nr:hypothetical protein [Nitrosovibrio sp. Nv6]SEO39820.1 hypothetical protein SAMN05216316_0127 [Nitrosovibrio sp. Nv6]